MAAGAPEPGDADAAAGREARHAGAHGRDATHDLVAGDDRELRLRQFAVDDVKIGSAHPAGLDAQQEFAGTGRGQRALLHDERRSGPAQDHGGERFGHDPVSPDAASLLLRKMRWPPIGKSAISPTRENPRRS